MFRQIVLETLLRGGLASTSAASMRGFLVYCATGQFDGVQAELLAERQCSLPAHAATPALMMPSFMVGVLALFLPLAA